MSRRTMTVDDLWALPRVGLPEPAPDGERFVVPVTTYSMDTNEGTTRLWLGDRALTTADASSGQPAWSPDGTRLAFVRKHEDTPQVWILPVDGGEAERVTDLPLGALDPKWFPDGQRIAFLGALCTDAPTPKKTARKLERDKDDPVKASVTEDRHYRRWDQWWTGDRCHHLFVLDLKTRQLTDLTPRFHCRFNPEEVAGQYAISPDGKEIAFSAVRSRPPHYHLLFGVFTVKVGGKAKPRDITPKDYPFAFSPSYAPDGRWILFRGRSDIESWADRGTAIAHDRRTGKHTLIAGTWDAFPLESAFSPDGRTVFFLADVEGKSGIFALGWRNALQRPGAKPKEIARGGTFRGLRAAGKRLFTSVSSLTAPPEAVSFAFNGGDGSELTSFTRSQVRKLRLARVRDLTFKGADDAPVQMFVLQPPADKKRKRPLVHLIHGGPHGVFGDQWHWRWNAQLVAAQGYVTAQVNFHGSIGWGRAFTRSIVGAWGDKPFTDVMRATDVLAKRGWVDEKRMAATGGSYGGYLSSWIASQTDRFACIVNHAGVCDLQTQVSCDIPQGWSRSAGGDLWSDLDGLDRYNPLRHAKGFKSPMLVFHGELDYRVPYYQGLQVYNVYKARKRPARLVCYPDEHHWILKPRNSRHWYGEFFGWLERWF